MAAHYVITPADVSAAAERIAGRVHETPGEARLPHARTPCPRLRQQPPPPHRPPPGHIPRPVLTCATLDRMASAGAVGGPRRLAFKCEAYQKSGSFKARGATNAVMSLSPAEAARGVCTHSSGNHAGALAYAAASRGDVRVPAFIVMPSNAPAVKRAAVEDYGGTVITCEPTQVCRVQGGGGGGGGRGGSHQVGACRRVRGSPACDGGGALPAVVPPLLPSQAAREAAAARVAADKGAVFIHPSEDPRVIAGEMMGRGEGGL
jgi:hypothetical protein